ncbi:hypothetical protein DPMN_093315 [Dreissena polymorpha]|uniref:Uncharacterized protein n=1 Tax=Dreissena polymorpha TaxID=45954 RepID=A0A9D4L3N0_DREPO|nr:hypothetical protein DPMN_093315 [Dreissena polymorpha]
MKRLRVVHKEKAKKVEERVSRMGDKIEGEYIKAAELEERVQVLVQEFETLLHSMSNNIIFTLESEATGIVMEMPEAMEAFGERVQANTGS